MYEEWDEARDGASGGSSRPQRSHRHRNRRLTANPQSRCIDSRMTCTLERLATIDVLVTAVVSLYYYLLIVKAMYITMTDSPLPTYQSDSSSKIALAVCTAGIALFGVVSCIYEWIAAAGL